MVLLPDQSGNIDPSSQPKVVQIECGLRHTLIRANNGNVYGFGDNSSGQLQTGAPFVIGKPRQLKMVSKMKGMVQRLHSGDNISFVTYENGQDLHTRKFFAWGDKNIIEIVS